MKLLNIYLSESDYTLCESIIEFFYNLCMEILFLLEL